MRRLLAIIALALLATSSASAATQATLVIRLKSVATANVPDDRGRKGASRGDRYVTRSRLLNVGRQFGLRHGAVVGRDAALLVLTSRSAGVIEGMALLPGGTIHFRGHVDLAVSGPTTVTGGTGRYAGARGTLVVGRGSSPLNTYRLTLPPKPDEHGMTLRA
jgi:hypothetical protein